MARIPSFPTVGTTWIDSSIQARTVSRLKIWQLIYGAVDGLQRLTVLINKHANAYS